ncbi:MAG: efflux RND transporter permease subunit [candidate division KSB1 bacterium]|nr:efflux RND transporter permease subunit [candidate division KSB1 bacterium]MDZ7304617.1 efflux RND transporter permease subunit [candidate division KSB1 bacterium]MDZ7313750.1 efflux RND transporter permease subunit [candidate division KSB1 bacterium]
MPPALGAGSEIRHSMAIVVFGALISSTLLTLVLVPVVYTYMEGLQRRFRRKKVDETNRKFEGLLEEVTTEVA